MCGIFGAISVNPDRPVEANRLVRASESLLHRGPDGFGLLLATKAEVHTRYDSVDLPTGEFQVGLTNRRLAIIDPGAGNQPMSNEDGSVWCVFNGEIYNYRELREELIAAGHRFRTNCDTEVLCHGYEEWGLQLAVRLKGIFAFAIYDRTLGELALFRDRFGVKPLNYSIQDGVLTFGSEVKALLAYDDRVTLRRDAIFEFFLFDKIPRQRTPFEGIDRLPPASFLVLSTRDLSRLREGRYWSLSFTDEFHDHREVVERFEGALQASVERQSISDVEVGTFLSGGLDSSLVTRSLMDIQAKVRAFHLYSNDDWSERAWATHDAFAGLNRSEILYDPSLDDCLEALKTLDVLLYDASLLPTHLISRATSKAGLKVVLSGDGGDENFAGYDAIFYPAWLYERFRPTGLGVWGQRAPLLDLFMRAQRLDSRYTPALRDYVHNRSVLPRHAAVDINNAICAHKAAAGAIDDYRRAQLPRFAGSEAATTDLNKLLFLYYENFLSGILEKVDFATMANSLEARVPLLDDDIVALATATAFSCKIRARGKYPLKVIAERRFDREFAYRQKRGFTFDFSKLFQRADVSDHLREVLRLPGVDEFLDQDNVERLLTQNRTDGRQGKKLWRALMFCEWFRNWGAAHA